MRRITMILVLAVALPCPAPAVAQTYAAGERPYAPGDCPNLRGERRENGTVPFGPTGTVPIFAANAAKMGLSPSCRQQSPAVVPTQYEAPAPAAPAVGDFRGPVRLLPPRGGPARGEPTPKPDRAGLSTTATVAGSLGVVLGIFFLVAWLMHRLAPQGQTVLPTEVFEVLGHAPLAGRQQVRLLRYGGKLLLVSVTATGAETLGEVTDPVEVDRLTALCRGGAGRAVETLRQAFGQRAAAPGGDLAGTPQRTTRRANGPDALEGRHA